MAYTCCVSTHVRISRTPRVAYTCCAIVHVRRSRSLRLAYTCCVPVHVRISRTPRMAYTCCAAVHVRRSSPRHMACLFSFLRVFSAPVAASSSRHPLQPPRRDKQDTQRSRPRQHSCAVAFSVSRLIPRPPHPAAPLSSVHALHTTPSTYSLEEMSRQRHHGSRDGNK